MGERWRSRRWRRWRRSRRRRRRRNRTVRERRRTWCRNWWWCCCSPQDRLSENIHCLCLNSCCKTPCGPKKGSKQIFPKCTGDCFFFTKCYFISRHKDEHLSSQKEIRLKFQKVLSEELKECQWRASITIQLSWKTKKLFHGIPMLENHPVSHKASTENHLYSSSKGFFWTIVNCWTWKATPAYRYHLNWTQWSKQRSAFIFAFISADCLL